MRSFRNLVARTLVFACLIGLASVSPAWCQVQTYLGRANLDGTNIETLRVDPGWSCTIQVHPSSGKLYWSYSSDGACGPFTDQEIRRSNLDGSGFEVVVTGRSMSELVGDHIYWIEPGLTGTDPDFFRSDLDGNAVELLGSFEDVDMRFLRVEPLSETFFWTPQFPDGLSAGQSRRTAFDGSDEFVYPFRGFKAMALLPGLTQIVGSTDFSAPFNQPQWIFGVDIDGENYEILFAFGDVPSPGEVEYSDPWIYWERRHGGADHIERASSCDDYRVLLDAYSFRDFVIDEANGKIYWLASEIPTAPNDPFANPPRNCVVSDVPAVTTTGALLTAGLMALAMLTMAKRRIPG